MDVAAWLHDLGMQQYEPASRNSVIVTRCCLTRPC